jgi:hypothetical protein
VFDDFGTSVAVGVSEFVVTAKGHTHTGNGSLSWNPTTVSSQNDEVDELVVTARRLAQRTTTCTLAHFGLSVAGLGLSSVGLPILDTATKIGGATRGTSIASLYARQLFGSTQLPIKIYAPTFKVLGNDLANSISEGGVRLSEGAMTNMAGKAVGRIIPFVGEALLAYDAVSILTCVVGN